MHDSLPTPADLRWLRRLAQVLLRDAHAADDLVQDTVVATLERPRPAGAAPRAWLGGIARRLALLQGRGEGRRRARERRVARPEAQPDSNELIERLDSAERLTAAVRGLPEPYREVLLLRFLDDREPSWIAERDGTPVDTVRRRIRRGLELLREDLERDSRARGSSWSVLLLPLAREGAGATPALASGSMTSVTTMTTLKLTLLTIASLFGVAGTLFLLQRPEAPAEGVVAPTEVGPAVEGSSSAPERTETPAASRVGPERVALEGDSAPPESPIAFAPQPAQGLHGIVVDERGRGVGGALVYATVVEIAPSEPLPDVEHALRALGYLEDVSTADARSITDRSGCFFIEDSELPPVGAGSERVLLVDHDEFVRAEVRSPGAGESSRGLQIQLERGRILRGRLIDETGLPVAGAELIAFAAEAAIEGDSPSALRILAEEQRLAAQGSDYHDCQVITDANGEFTVTGIPSEEVVLVSLEPDLALVGPERTAWSSGFVEFEARRCLGLHVDVVDAPAVVVGEVQADIRVILTFDDGTREGFELGARGDGGVEYRFELDSLPGRVEAPWRKKRVVEAVAHTSLTLSGERASTKAETGFDADGVRELMTAEIPYRAFDGITGADRPNAFGEMPPALLVLTPRHSDGSPVTGRVGGAWTSRRIGREPISEPFDDRPGRTGQLVLLVPEGNVEVVIDRLDGVKQAVRATAERHCSFGNRSDVSLGVPRPCSTTLIRPEGWQGKWHVEASYRTGIDEPWVGSWTYSAAGPSLTLRGLLPYEWRFRFRRGAEGAVERERSVALRAGDRALVR